MKYFVTEQIAPSAPETFHAALPGIADSATADWVRPHGLELAYTSHRIASYAVDVLGLPPGVERGPPFRWLPERREQLRVELGAAMFHRHCLARDEVEHVFDSFSVVRRYEERDHGEFRTKLLILATSNAMSDVAALGTVYVSPLDPPPGAGPRHPRSV